MLLVRIFNSIAKVVIGFDNVARNIYWLCSIEDMNQL